MSNRSIKYLEKIYNHLDDEYNKILNNSSTSTDNDGLSLLDSERIIQYLTLSILTAEYYSKDFYYKFFVLHCEYSYLHYHNTQKSALLL